VPGEFLPGALENSGRRSTQTGELYRVSYKCLLLSELAEARIFEHPEGTPPALSLPRTHLEDCARKIRAREWLLTGDVFRYKLLRRWRHNTTYSASYVVAGFGEKS